MKPARARFVVEFDTSMTRDVDHWTTVLNDLVRSDSRTNGDHPFVAFDSVTGQTPEAGDVLTNSVDIDSLPNGAVVESAGKLYHRIDDRNDDLPWALIDGDSYAWRSTSELGALALVRFIP